MMTAQQVQLNALRDVSVEVRDLALGRPRQNHSVKTRTESRWNTGACLSHTISWKYSSSEKTRFGKPMKSLLLPIVMLAVALVAVNGTIPQAQASSCAIGSNGQYVPTG